RIGVQHPHAVRADQAHAGGADEILEAPLPYAAVLRYLGESGGDHHDAPYAGGGAVADGLFHHRCRNGNHGEVDGSPDGADARETWQALDVRGLRVDGIDGAGKAVLPEVRHQRRTDRSRAARGADDGHGTRAEQGADALRRRGAFALQAHFEKLLGLGGADAEVDDTGFTAAPDHEAALRKDLEHAIVLAEHVRLELGDAGSVGDQRQMLQQHGADAAALMRVRDREGDLGTFRRVRRHDVASHADDVLGAALQQRRDQADVRVEVQLGEARQLLVREAPLQPEEAEIHRPL